MQHTVTNITENTEYSFAFFEDAELCFCNERDNHPRCEIILESYDKTLAKYFPE